MPVDILLRHPAQKMNRVFLTLSRHDDHNLEIKSIVEMEGARFCGTVDVYVFVPRSVQLLSWSKEEVLSDFRSRVRLAIPVGQDGGKAALEAALERLRRAGRRGDPSEAMRRVAAVVAESLGVRASHARKALARRDAAEAGAQEEQVARGIEETAAWLGTIRLALRELHRPHHARDNTGALLDEYLSHLFVQYLGGIRREIERRRRGEGDLATVEDALTRAQEAEVGYREGRLYGGGFLAEGPDRERELIRLSQLKKFFQSSLFVDVEKHPTIQKLAEPAAAVGAGIAALWMALFQRNVDGVGPGAAIALPGSTLLASGVAAYILKDRLKEWGRRYFAKRAARLFPDVNQRLTVDDAELGRLCEWLKLTSSRAVPGDIQSLRRRASLTELESELPEDVVHYRVRHDVRAVEAAALQVTGGSWGLQSLLRVNLERYLKNMDDPYKDVSALEPDGRIRVASCHRVYPFYVLVRSRHRFFGASRGRRSERLAGAVGKDKIYRIVMDKNGIDRVEPIGPPRDR